MAVETRERFREAVTNAIRACSLPSRDGGTPPEEGLDLGFEALGFDSLSFMEFCISIQCDTGIALSVGKLRDLGTPEAVAAYLAAHA
jgi:acyl carrier protein